MHKGRLEAFSDGVMAIIITIMVLEIKVPHGAEWENLVALYPKLISYIISFIYVAIYWNNHHHMLQATKSVNGRILWANMAFLFFMSLFPFTSGWMGENHFAALPISAFGFILLMCSLTWTILYRELVKIHEKDSTLSHASGKSKVILSNVFYILAMITPFWSITVGLICTVIPGIMWLIPDRKIELELSQK